MELSDLIGSQPDDDATLRQEWHDGDFVRATIESFSSRELFSYVRKFWLGSRNYTQTRMIPSSHQTNITPADKGAHSVSQAGRRGQIEGAGKRRVFRWAKEAKELAINYRECVNRGLQNGTTRRALVLRLVEVSGNPQDACLRFLRQLGVSGTRRYRAWTKPEQQRLLDLIASLPVQEAARVIGRPTPSVRSMLHRLGVGARRGREWFTKHTLAEALHIRHDEVQKWIDRGWLKSRSFQTSGVKMQIIDPDDFCKFFKEHGREVVGRRLSYAGLWFVCNYVFPPKHAELLSLRGSYNKQSTGRLDLETECVLEKQDETLDQAA
jgi:hypothetical protein